MRIALVICLLGIWACGASEEPSTPAQTWIEDSTELDWAEATFEDSLQLKQGDLPEDWEKVDLNEGFYVAFPQKPRRKSRRNWVDYKLKRKDYTFIMHLTDLSEDSVFVANRKRRNAYYKALVDDVIQDIDTEEKPADLVEQKPFFFLDLYEGFQTVIESEDVTVFSQYVIIGDVLYTQTFFLWDDLTPANEQLKDRFFHSFGKELYIE